MTIIARSKASPAAGEIYSRRKNNCQKILPAHSMITKHDFILRGSCFWETYSNELKPLL